jgi:E3 Ubiquitin ligase
MHEAAASVLFNFCSAGYKSGNDPLRLLGNPVIWAIIGFAAGIYLFIRGFALLHRKRSILDVPRSTIRGASLGLVEVSGRVEGPYTIVAPLSEADCFYYRTIAWTGGESSWRKAAEESLSTPFFLDDGTGKLMVNARGAETELEAVFCDEYSGSVPDYAQHFLNRHGIAPASRVRFEEYAVRAGQTLFAMGTLRENATAPDAFLSAEAAALEREEEIGGVLSPGASAARQKVAISQSFDPRPKVMLTSAPGRPLFVSLWSQREVVQALSWKSALYIWGGPILSVLCFWYLTRA